VQVLLTVGLIAIVAAWAAAVYSRLFRLRAQVKDAWTLLEADQSKVAAQHVYNAHAAKYNAALDNFPAYLVGPMSGLKPARLFKSESRDSKPEV
jgi:hypothetical protein